MIFNRGGCIQTVTVPLAPTPHSELSTFLSQFPWRAQYTALGKPLEWLWHFDLQATAESAWPHLADTSRLNRSMGLPEMKLLEKQGEVHGTTNYWGIPMTWIELPWEWVHGKSLVCVREYSRGFAHVFRGICKVDTLPGNQGIRVYIYFAWIPTNFVWRAFLQRVFPKLEPVYGKALKRIEKFLSGSAPAPYRQPITTLPATTAERLAGMLTPLEKAGTSRVLLGKLSDLILQGDEMDLDRIRVLPLADSWGVPVSELLVAMLNATRQGIFNLTWDVICPHCRGVRDEVGQLGNLPKRSHCDTCHVTFATDSENAIEVTFHIHPSLRNISKLFYCSAEPAKRAHIRLQGEAAPAKTISYHPLLAPGRYRFRTQGAEGHSTLVVSPGAAQQHAEFETGVSGQHVMVAPGAEVRIRNPGSDTPTFVLEEIAWRENALRPAHLFNLQDFHDLFSEEYLAADVQLDVGEQTIMFTDMVGSTRLFGAEGDAKAFARVKSHFAMIHDLAKAHEGAVIKTIGDATLIAFNTPLQALQASVDLQRQTAGTPADKRIPVRIAINTGTCIAVNLNRMIDYFGKTVIIASRLQKQAGAFDVVFSQHAFTASAKWLAAEKLEAVPLTIALPELNEQIAAYKIHVPCDNE